MALTTVNTTTIKTALGATTTNIRELCTHANLNPWSVYRPGYWYESANTLTYRPPRGGAFTDTRGNNPETGRSLETYRFGDFRGYNHSAVIPTMTAPSDLTYGSSSAGSSVTRGITVYVGEFDWAGSQTVYRALNALTTPVSYVYVLDAADADKGSALLPATNGNVTVNYSFTVPNAGSFEDFTVKVAFGDSSTIFYKLGNSYGALGEDIFRVTTLAARVIYAVQFDDTYITGGDNPPYTSIEGIGTTDNYFTGTNTAVWKFNDTSALKAWYNYPTDYDLFINITADWYIKGFASSPTTEYLAKSSSAFVSGGNNTVTLPVGGSPSTFGDGDKISLILRNISINY